MVNSCYTMTKRPRIHNSSENLKNLIEDLKVTAIRRRESSRSTLESLREYPIYKGHLPYMEPQQQIATQQNQKVLEIIDSESSSINSESLSLDSKQRVNLWSMYFHDMYIDAEYNTISNYTIYLESSLKLISLLPGTALQSQVIEKTVHLEKKSRFEKTLILDLDETLIHADLDYNFENHDVVLESTECDEAVPLFQRPCLFEFLNFAKNNFEVILFTSSCKEYADTILKHIDPDNSIFSHRLYRESCVYLEPGIYIKDLRILANRDLKDVVLIDNNIYSFANQLDNGILVSSFYQTEEESILTGLIGYLNSVILPSHDVREMNQECLRFNEYKNELYRIMKDEFFDLKDVDMNEK
jgi:Dullard-like phosphatase family protein